MGAKAVLEIIEEHKEYFFPQHVYDELQFTVEWCSMCGHHIRCPGCGNNACNAGYGEIDGRPCTICPLTYQYQKDMFAMMHRQCVK